MERERNKMTEKILNLTLDIIYLLTGENYIAFKLSNGLLSSSLTRKGQSPFLEPPSHSMTKNKKVQEVTSEIIELLTGEVPIRCQDVIVQDLQNSAMREEQPALTPPERTFTRHLPERHPCPPQDHHSILQDYQGEDMIVIKAEAIDEDELYVRVDGPCKEEGIPNEIGVDERFTRSERHPLILAVNEIEDDFSIRNSVSPNLHPVYQGVDLSTRPSTHGGYYSERSCTAAFNAGRRRSKNFPCPECGKCFTQRAHLHRHEKVHLDEKPYSCSICGRCYAHKSQLTSHLRSHTGEKWFSCPECGICFGHKISLVRHRRIHTNEGTFSCSDCGRGFTQKSHLVDHRRTHTGEKPYSCSQCGKRFAVKRGLVSHEKIHGSHKVFPCSECGKCFTRKSCLVSHQRVHE